MVGEGEAGVDGGTGAAAGADAAAAGRTRAGEAAAAVAPRPLRSFVRLTAACGGKFGFALMRLALAPEGGVSGIGGGGAADTVVHRPCIFVKRCCGRPLTSTPSPMLTSGRGLRAAVLECPCRRANQFCARIPSISECHWACFYSSFFEFFARSSRGPHISIPNVP